MTQKFFLSSFLFLALILSGCGVNSNVKPPQEPFAMLQLADKNMRDMQVVSSDGNFKLHFAGQTQDAKTTSFDVNLHINMQQDFADPKVSSMFLDFDGTVDGASSLVSDKNPFPISVTAQVFADNTAAYVKISSLKSKEEILPPDAQKQLIGQWWQIPLPPGAFEKFITDIRAQQSSSQLSALTGQSVVDFPNFLADQKYFEKLDYQGVSAVKAGDSFRYAFTFGKPFFDAVKATFSKDQKFTDTQMKDFEQAFNVATGSGEAFVSVDKNYLTKMILKASAPRFVDSEGSEGSFDLDFNIESYDFGKKPSFSIPSDAKIFDVGAFLGNFSAAMQQ